MVEGAPPQPHPALGRWAAAVHQLSTAEPTLGVAYEAACARAAELAPGADDGSADPSAWLAFYEAAEAVVRRVAELDGALATATATRAFGAASGEVAPRVAAEGYFLCAVARTALRQNLPALEALEAALAHARNSGCDALRVSVLLIRGRLLVLLGDVPTASATLLEGADLARRLGARRHEARMLGNLGFLYGEDDGAAYEAYTRRALAISREIGDERLVAHSLCNLGGALVQNGSFEEAWACHREGRPLAERLGWQDSVALFEAGMGGLLASTGDIEGGAACYGRSIAHFAATGDLFQCARQELILARHLLRAGQPERARDHLLSAEARCGGDASRATAWQVQDVLAHVLEALGDLAGAIRALRTSIARREQQLEQRAADRLRVLEFHVVAERAMRDAAEAQRRSEELQLALERQHAQRVEIERLVGTDVLTGLPNRRQMVAVAEEKLARARATGQPLSLVLLDLDHFKRINDERGHAAGDDVLVDAGRRLSEGLRDGDIVARWGGEEFCLLLPGADLPAACGVVDRLLEGLRARPAATREGPQTVTASAGVTELDADDPSLDALLQRADLALYAAKRGGRDRLASLAAERTRHDQVGRAAVPGESPAATGTVTVKHAPASPR